MAAGPAIAPVTKVSDFGQEKVTASHAFCRAFRDAGYEVSSSEMGQLSIRSKLSSVTAVTLHYRPKSPL